MEKKATDNNRNTVYSYVPPDEKSGTRIRYNLSRISKICKFDIIWGYDLNGVFHPPVCFLMVVDRNLISKKEWRTFLDSYELESEEAPVIIIVDETEGYADPPGDNFRKISFIKSAGLHPVLSFLMDKDNLTMLELIIDFTQPVEDDGEWIKEIPVEEGDNGVIAGKQSDDEYDEERTLVQLRDIKQMLLENQPGTIVFTYLDPTKHLLLQEAIDEWSFYSLRELTHQCKIGKISYQEAEEIYDKEEEKKVVNGQWLKFHSIGFLKSAAKIICLIDRQVMGLSAWNKHLEDLENLDNHPKVKYIIVDDRDDYPFPTSNYIRISLKNIIQDDSADKEEQYHAGTSAILYYLDNSTGRKTS